MTTPETTPEFHRIEPRYRLNSGVDVRVLVQPQGSPEPVDAQLVDMSNSGLQLRLSTCLKFDESMAVHILAGDLQFDLAATVKWIRQADEQDSFVGCHIKPELSEDALNRLASMGLLDRRESVRKEVKLPASICGELESTRTPAVIRNLSEDGFGIATQTSRVVGQRIRVAVAVGDGDDDSLEITARVIWQIKTQGGFFCGCAFLNRESYSQLSGLVSDGRGASVRRRRGRSARRTSMWVALAALVVFVFPSLIVLLMNEHESPATATASRETTGAKTPTQTQAPAGRESRPAPVAPQTPPQATEKPVAPTEPPAPADASPPAATTSAVPLTFGPNDTSAVDVSAVNAFDRGNSGDGATDGDRSADVAAWPPHATEPELMETPVAEFSVTPLDELPTAPADNVVRPPVVTQRDVWLGRALGSAYDFDRALRAAAEASAPPEAIDRPSDEVAANADADPATTAASSPVPADTFRTWVDSTGTYRVVARLISVENGVARLLKENGRYASVPVDRLSKEDAEFVDRWLAARAE
ncbi:MAG: hypothetical protein DCC68_17850 [Planctomycetota bacterium]|nr:MAG: hypothetical protein DCC68_17850 [Planctomycetota bacterium]